ncbi:MAG: heme-binding protein [Gammaproteobacteria bacterium]|nr:heme-binding protein [Gammaproteobacteria bacterium]
MKKISFGLNIFMLSILSFSAFAEQPVTVPIQRLSLDMATKAAQAAIKECRKLGVQVAVTLVDRGGHPQVVLRDVLAMDLTLPISRDKAYTAMSFNTPTAGLIKRLEHANSIGKIEGVIAAQGGLPITAAGTLLGGIGVSGAPSGITDEKCAKAGLNAIAADLDMADF